MTPEGAIKKQICDWLSWQKDCFFWIQQAGKIPGRINRSKYLHNGISDILGIWKTKMLCIEVKAPGGKLSDQQKVFLERMASLGAIAFVAYSLDDVVRTLKGNA